MDDEKNVENFVNACDQDYDSRDDIDLKIARDVERAIDREKDKSSCRIVEMPTMRFDEKIIRDFLGLEV